jgi:hypothetical protein
MEGERLSNFLRSPESRVGKDSNPLSFAAPCRGSMNNADTDLSILPWAESDGELPAGHQDAQVQHLHRVIVCGHNVIFADDLEHI